MKIRRSAPLLGLIVILGVVALFFATSVPSAGASDASRAPNFTLPTIYGQNFTLSDYRNTSVVVIEFTALSCSECQIVEQSLQTLYAEYDAGGSGSVQIISIFIQPQFGDTIPALQSYQVKNHVNWTMAQDTNSLAVKNAYGVSDIPTVVIVNKQGYPVYDVVGAQSTSQLKASVSSALSGTATTISLVPVGVFALAAIAGVTTFFSPCAFPMFPGYMGLFLGLNASGVGAQALSRGSYGGTVKRAVSAGSITAIGMMIVFVVIGVALIYAANFVGAYIPDLLILVGVVLVGLGALMFTNLQYWRIVAPLQAFWGRLRGQTPGAAAAPVGPAGATGGRFYLKLFSYGMGYAAAAAGCVAPVIFSAIIAGIALGFVGGLLSILIYSLTAALLMIAVTVMLAVAGKKYVNQLKAYTPIIKKVSAGALVIVGVYLVYFYYAAWIA